MDWDPRYLYTPLFGGDTEAMESFLSTVCVPGGEWHLSMDAGRPIDEAISEMVALYPEQAELVKAWADPEDAMVRRIFEGTVDILKELKARGVPCYALSNMEQQRYERRKERHAFMSWFDGAYISGYEGVVKPEPRFFELALERFGLQASSSVFIDDRSENVAAAAGVGLRTVLFRSPAQVRQELAGLGLLSAGATTGLSSV